jgi:hypothetical protein
MKPVNRSRVTTQAKGYIVCFFKKTISTLKSLKLGSYNAQVVVVNAAIVRKAQLKHPLITNGLM